MAELKIVRALQGVCRPCPGSGGCVVGFYRAHTQNWGRADVRTPMYVAGGNYHFCPAAPMRCAPQEFLSLLPNSCDPNRGRTASKTGREPLMLGTLTQDLKSPVQLPSLVLRQERSLRLSALIFKPLSMLLLEHEARAGVLGNTGEGENMNILHS